MDNSAALGLGVMLFLFIMVVCLAFAVFMMYLVYNAMKGVPIAHRPMEPGMVFLMLIPLFNFFWVFKVFPPMMQAYKNALAEKGVAVAGDGGQGIAMAYCICVCLSIIPYINLFAGLASLVLFIMTMVKAYELKRLVA